MWLHSLKVAQLLRSAACLHTNQSRSYLNHLVRNQTPPFCYKLVKHPQQQGGSSSASTPRSMICYSILLAHALRPRTFHSSATFPGVTTKHPGCLWMEIDGVFRRIAVLLKRISLSPVMLRCTGCRLPSNTLNAPIELSSNFFPYPLILTKTDSRRLHSVVR